MKKKVALLLAVIMVLSMLPMNVFGFRVQQFTTPSNPQARLTEVTFNMAALLAGQEWQNRNDGTSTAMVNLSLAGDWNRRFATVASLAAPLLQDDLGSNAVWSGYALLTPIGAPVQGTPGLASTIPTIAGTVYAQISINGNNASIIFTKSQLAQPWEQGLITVVLPIITNNANNTLTATGANGTVLIDAMNLLVGGAAVGVVINGGDPVPFQQAAFLRDITLRERSVGQLDGQRVIRLTAPVDYMWSTRDAAGGILGNEQIGGGTIGGLQVIANNGAFQNPIAIQNTNVFTDGQGRQVLDIFVTLNRTSQPIANFIETLIVRGLVLVAAPGAPASGEVRVYVELGRWGVAPGTGGDAATPIFHDALINTATGQRFPQAFVQGTNTLINTDVASLHNRSVTATMTFRYINGVRVEAPEVSAPLAPGFIIGLGPAIVGWLGGTPYAPGTGFNPIANSFTANDGAWRSSKHVANRTAQDLEVVINEDAPRALWTGLLPERNAAGDFVNFGYNTQGNHRTARVLVRELAPGALNTSIFNSVIEFSLADDIADYVDIVGAAWRFYNAGDQNIGWRPVTVDRTGFDNLPNVLNQPGSAFLANDTLSIFLPRHINPHQLRRVEVAFFVSIEAGAEYKLAAQGIDPEINIVVGGNATAAALDGYSNTVTVATFRDPIHVELVGDTLRAPVADVFNLTQWTPVGDLVITEATAGRLGRGQTFRVDVLAQPDVFWQSPALRGGTVTATNGMELRRTMGQGFIEFTVVRPSTGDGAVITISDLEVLGGIFPGVDYVFAVSGTNPVLGAANTLSGNTTWIDRDTNAATQNLLASPGFFNAVPYAVSFIEFGDLDYIGGDDAPGNYYPDYVQPGRPPVVLTRMADAQVAVSTGNIVGFVFRTNPVDTTLVTGYIALRDFAENFLGVEPQWDGATNTVTISATDQYGDVRTLVVVVDNTQATIDLNGQHEFVDIASYVNFASGPAGSVAPRNENGTVYLPLRFVTEFFGGQVAAIGNPPTGVTIAD